MSQHHQIGGLSVDCPGLEGQCKYCRMGNVPVVKPDPLPPIKPLPGAAAGASGTTRPPLDPSASRRPGHRFDGIVYPCIGDVCGYCLNGETPDAVAPDSPTADDRPAEGPRPRPSRVAGQRARTMPAFTEMTLRDFFAGCALIGITSNAANGTSNAVADPASAFEMADAMLEARLLARQDAPAKPEGGHQP